MTEHNTLYYGDNLRILRDYISSESVDLVYLDPPFNSNRAYNVLFKEKSGEASPAQIEAFTDTWEWDRVAERTFDDLISDAPANVAQMIAALRQFVGSNDMMAYLVMMAARLVELHRVLRPTGSLYLHCDPTASHYLKIILDTIFGKNRFRNEIIWHYNTGVKGRRNFLRKHDVILWFSKSDIYTFNQKEVALPRKVGTAHLRQGVDEDGREYYEDFSPRKSGKKYRWYLDQGLTPMDVWTDIQAINPVANERLGYPTQKPLALLERIITASSARDQVVLDPFCGCGTAIVAAQKLGRRWIGIDVTHLSIALMRYRLNDAFPDAQFDVRGEPSDVGGARMLAETDRYQFQWWALSLVRAKPIEGKEKKGADKGVDGVINFVDDQTGKLKRCLVQVKSGHVQRRDVGDFVNAVSRDKAEMGLFITLDASTGPMRQDATQAGWYRSEGWGRDYPKVQILTIAELLDGRTPDMPPARQTFSKAERIKAPAQQQPMMASLFEEA